CGWLLILERSTKPTTLPRRTGLAGSPSTTSGTGSTVVSVPGGLVGVTSKMRVSLVASTSASSTGDSTTGAVASVVLVREAAIVCAGSADGRLGARAGAGSEGSTSTVEGRSTAGAARIGARGASGVTSGA